MIRRRCALPLDPAAPLAKSPSGPHGSPVARHHRGQRRQSDQRQRPESRRPVRQLHGRGPRQPAGRPAPGRRPGRHPRRGEPQRHGPADGRQPRRLRRLPVRPGGRARPAGPRLLSEARLRLATRSLCRLCHARPDRRRLGPSGTGRRRHPGLRDQGGREALDHGRASSDRQDLQPDPGRATGDLRTGLRLGRLPAGLQGRERPDPGADGEHRHPRHRPGLPDRRSGQPLSVRRLRRLALRVPRQDPARPAREPSALEPRRGSGRRPAGRGAGPGICPPALPGFVQDADGDAGRQPQRRHDRAPEGPGLDERGHARAGPAEDVQVRREDRLPREVARL
uniref:LigA n=1 Tax=Parastrongyloides trichosuri TaxID=131310 RepID=A0A0N4Z3V0_PARTI